MFICLCIQVHSFQRTVISCLTGKIIIFRVALQSLKLQGLIFVGNAAVGVVDGRVCCCAFCWCWCFLLACLFVCLLVCVCVCVCLGVFSVLLTAYGGG